MKNFIKKNKKYIIIGTTGLCLLLIGLISWELVFSKYKIFNDNEKEFTKAAKRYYEYHKQNLPKKGESREVTLQDLYSLKQIDDLYVPKSRKMCDTSSWVRVYMDENGEYQYLTYLKCGKYESKVDHKGPTITLNGDKKIYIALNGTYEELGVDKVVDNKDKKIDLDKVVIDSSKVDTTKTGEYKVTYTVKDSNYNKTVLERTVVVTKSLTDTIREKTASDGYYKGLYTDNYILFSGMLWRIVNVNDDGTIKIVTNSNIANIPYGNLDVEYSDSNIREWLNNYFYSYISSKDYIVEDSNWCIDNLDNTNTSDQCNSVITDKVGTLTISDWNKSLEESDTYLNSIGVYWFMNKKNGHFAYMHSFFAGGITDAKSTDVIGVRPVVNLKNNLYITSGKGTADNPYLIGDYKLGKANELLKDRIVGEYVDYSGMTFRISDFDEDENIKLVSVGYLPNTTENSFLTAKYNNENNVMLFDPSEEGNIGYTLNNDYLDYIDTSLLVSKKYDVYQYDESKLYKDYEVKKSYKSKISIPSSFELFSGINGFYDLQVNYWLLDYVSDDSALMINNSNGKAFNISKDLYDDNAFKIVIYVKNSAKITQGNGTYNKPFSIK